VGTLPRTADARCTVADRPAPPTSELLRSSTAALHLQLEVDLDLTGGWDRPRYLRVLGGFDAFLSAWEPRLSATLDPVLPGFVSKRRRSDALRRDLALLAPGATHAPAHEVAWIPLETEAHALGSLYVLEGSTLGARIILRRLQSELGVSADCGTAYFSGYGQATGSMWRDFRSTLDRRVPPDDPGAQHDASAAAVATFVVLIAVFRRV
jgi:heme oxygenase (biliverdin-IX-beta and delta-forming)